MTFPGLRLSDWFTLHGFFTLLAVLIYTVHAHTMRQRRAPTAAIAWMLFILMIPYVALPAYLLFGTRKVVKPVALPFHRPEGDLQAAEDWVADTLRALGQRDAVDYVALQLHADGRASRAALFEMLQGARQSIDICTFLIGRDAVGDAVLQLLCTRARAGVRVRLLVDGLGWWMGGRPRLRQLGQAGVDWRLFVPPWHSPLRGRSNLRNHRKMLIVDAGTPAARLWCGGRNLAQEYFEGGTDAAPWHDLTFDVQGALVAQAGALFEHDWRFTAQEADASAPSPATSALPPPASAIGALIVASGPDQFDDSLHALLVTAAYRARDRLAMVTPYFVPDSALLMALCMAARRGVQVDLLLPARSNHPISDFARSRALRTLAQAGGRIWLAPTMLHAKLVLVDDILALAGSANLDSRSLFINYELMVAFHRPQDIARFADWYSTERRQAVPFAAHRPGLARDVAEGLLLWVGFQL